MLHESSHGEPRVRLPSAEHAARDAIHDAVQRQDWEAFTHLVVHYAVETLTHTSHFPDLVEALMNISKDARDAHPELLPYLEWVGAIPVSKDAPVVDVEALSAGGEESMLAIRALITSITARRLHHRIDQALRLVVAAHPHVLKAVNQIGSPAETIACAYFVQAGNTLLLVNDFSRAEAMFLLAWRWRHVDALGFVAHEAAGKIAALCASTGRLNDAEQWLRRARRMPGPIIERFKTVAHFAVPLAEFLIATERLELDQADALLPKLAQPTHGFEFDTWILWAQVRWLLVSGRRAEALKRLEESPEATTEQHHDAFERLRICALLAVGRVDDAISRLEQLGNDHHTHLLRARAAAMRADYSTALYQLDRCSSLTSGRLALEAQGLLAASLLALNRQSEARTAFEALLDALNGNLAVFTTIDSFSLRLLFSLCRDHPLARTTERAFNARQVRSIYRFEPRTELPKPVRLTDRELIILRHLSSGASRIEIARREIVSINTVKSQIAAIYRKLGCSRPEDAILRARALGLL